MRGLGVAVLAAAGLAGCGGQPRLSSAQLQHLQTRRVDAAPDAAFDAAARALMDAHYQLIASDKRGGVLSGQKCFIGEPRLLAPASPRPVRLSVKIDPESRGSTVRATTLVNNEPRVDEEALKEFFALLGRGVDVRPGPGVSP
jgi:hypothetical protein